MGFKVIYEFASNCSEELISMDMISEAIEKVTDDLGRRAAEGRVLPQTLLIVDADESTDKLKGEILAPPTISNNSFTTQPVSQIGEILAQGKVAPRKGCCSGWEITWVEPQTATVISTVSL